MKKITFLLLSVAALYFFTNALQDPPTDASLQKRLINDYNVYALPLPTNLTFAGEPVPLDNPDIRERLDRELLVNTYWQSSTLLLIKRAHKYFPEIEAILAAQGVPDDFKYLAVAESGLQNNRSPAGAAGFWHFLKTTGKEYGLEVNSYVDERYNLQLATQVAAAYLKNSKEKFGNWTMAAAAYNAGNAGMQRQINRQKQTDYYQLILNEETSRYVFRILALKEILSNPEKYGFNFRDKDLYKPIPSRKIMVDTAVQDFARFAEDFNINYKILKLHNPWLRDTYLKNASRKKYFIEIPEEGYYQLGQ